jgi:hypothetical protein
MNKEYDFPRFNGKELDDINKARFSKIIKVAFDSIRFDMQEGEHVPYSDDDIEMFAHNIANNLLLSEVGADVVTEAD